MKSGRSSQKSFKTQKGEKRGLERLASRRSSSQSVSLFSISEDLSIDSIDTDDDPSNICADDPFDNVIPRREYSKQHIKEQTKDLEEAFFLYAYAEKAAKKIQLAFRERKEAKLDADKPENSTENTTKCIEKDDNDDDDDDASQEQDYIMLFVLVGCFLYTWIPKLLACCYSLISGGDTGEVDAAANAAMQPGGGGGAAGPSGAEGAAGGGAQAGAQGAMAAQAASSAASGAASGVGAGAAAGKYQILC